MRAFAHFIANAHSWYKHLPLRGAGEPFVVNLTVKPHAAYIDRDDGTSVARDVIRERGPGSFYEYRIDLRPGDIDPGETGPRHYLFGGIGTAEYREQFGGWQYWNHGPPTSPELTPLLTRLRTCGQPTARFSPSPYQAKPWTAGSSTCVPPSAAISD